MKQPAFTHRMPNYVFVCVIQTIIGLMGTIWRNTQYERLKVLDSVMKQINAFGDLVGHVEAEYDDPVQLTDVDRGCGIHVLRVMLQMCPGEDLYEVVVRSDKPRTEIELCQLAHGAVKTGKDINVFQPIFDDELAVKGWRDEP